VIRVTSAVIRVTRQSVQSHCDSHSQPTPGGEGLQCASGDLASESRCAQTAAIAARAKSPDAPSPPAILSRAQGPGRVPVTGPGGEGHSASAGESTTGSRQHQDHDHPLAPSSNRALPCVAPEQYRATRIA
jgi:hypothetical protein